VLIPTPLQLFADSLSYIGQFEPGIANGIVYKETQREPIGTKGKIVGLDLKRTGLMTSGDSSVDKR
jgi:hypothetical protein